MQEQLSFSYVYLMNSEHNASLSYEVLKRNLLGNSQSGANTDEVGVGADHSLIGVVDLLPGGVELNSNTGKSVALDNDTKNWMDAIILP